ncbi:hypothetical protein BDN67DRAFT_989992 [Paxillus ammoniavirescens]|nr:hypothetical protein BDN67DRAFT_989992 [Paxillus ammoniavirescens]
MVRGTGKFKTKRGGGRNFSKDMVLDSDGTAVSRARLSRRDNDDDDNDDDDSDVQEEEEEEEEESGEEEEEGATASGQPELTRIERRELKKKQAAEKQAQKNPADENEEDADLINPNHVEKKLNISDLSAPRELTRKEREAKQKQEAEKHYWKLHLAGETDRAKSDLARLKKIKEEREAAQAKRKAEAEAKAAEIDAKKKAATSGKRT